MSILASKEKISADQFTLQDIEFSTEPQTLTVITGPVGSGKSTLLSAIAGEVPVAAGTISWPTSLVYVPPDTLGLLWNNKRKHFIWSTLQPKQVLQNTGSMLSCRRCREVS